MKERRARRKVIWYNFCLAKSAVCQGIFLAGDESKLQGWGLGEDFDAGYIRYARTES